jgi:hypothetical protein
MPWAVRRLVLNPDGGDAIKVRQTSNLSAKRLNLPAGDVLFFVGGGGSPKLV